MPGKITSQQAAATLGITKSRVNALIRNGQLPAERFGQVWMIKPEDVEAIRDRPPAGRPPKGKEAPAKKMGRVAKPNH